MGAAASQLPDHRSDGLRKNLSGLRLGPPSLPRRSPDLYYYAPKLFRALQTGQVDGSLPSLLKKVARAALVIIDDFGIAAVAGKQYRDLLEILDDRQGVGATLITSQFPLNQRHEIIADATVADAILDRLVHNAYRIELKGESMRKHSAAASSKPTPSDS